MTSYQVITGAFVNVLISTNVSSIKSERKFAKDLTIFDLKGKLELITGAVTSCMDISVYDETDETKLVCELDDNDRLLGSYPVDSGMTLFVKDRTKSGISNNGENGKQLGEFEDVSKVEKYELTEDEYAKRGDTVQSYLKRNKMGKYNAEEMQKLDEQKAQQIKDEKEIAANFKIGDRCEVDVPGGGGKRLGAVKFIGETHFKPDVLWIGVQYDEPLGKNDGAVGGKRYFECPNKYGGFVKPMYVKVGDYPEEDLDLSDDEM